MKIRNKIKNQVSNISDLLLKENSQLAIAESCTGGLISAFCTDLSGSSRWFYATVVSYSNQSKKNLLHVASTTLEKYGAVSKETVKEMCKGLLEITSVDYVIAVSGVAGPKGGTQINPVGSVWVAVYKKDGKNIIKKYIFDGGRENIRYNTVLKSLQNLEKLIKGYQL